MEKKDFMIACGMVRDELELAMERTGNHPEILWLEKGLHDSPAKLHDVLQSEIDRAAQTHDEILLSLCLCGGAMDGIGSDRAKLVVPKFDDCVRMLLAVEPGVPSPADCHCLYFTQQWMDSDRYIMRDFASYREKYSPRQAKLICQTMLANYQGIRLIDTGAYPIDRWEAKAKQDAKSLHLEYGVQQGTVRVLEKLLRHQFDDEFLVAAPGEHFTQRQFLGY